MRDASSAIKGGSSGWTVHCFWKAARNQSHIKLKLALSAVQNTRNRKAEFETKKSEAPSAELPTKTVKAVTQVNNAMGAKAMNSLEINYERAAAEFINKLKKYLPTKEIEQRLKQEIEKQKLNETLSMSVPMPDAEVGATKSGNCNTLKMVTGKPFGITKIGARVMSVITSLWAATK